MSAITLEDISLSLVHQQSDNTSQKSIDATSPPTNNFLEEIIKGSGEKLRSFRIPKAVPRQEKKIGKIVLKKAAVYSEENQGQPKTRNLETLLGTFSSSHPPQLLSSIQNVSSVLTGETLLRTDTDPTSLSVPTE